MTKSEYIRNVLVNKIDELFESISSEVRTLKPEFEKLTIKLDATVDVSKKGIMNITGSGSVGKKIAGEKSIIDAEPFDENQPGLFEDEKA